MLYVINILYNLAVPVELWIQVVALLYLGQISIH